MKPEGALEMCTVIGVTPDFSEVSLAEVISGLQRLGTRGEVYEVKVTPSVVIEALRVSAAINTANVGFFVKLTIAWDYARYEWSLRCGDVEAWSPGA